MLKKVILSVNYPEFIDLWLSTTGN